MRIRNEPRAAPLLPGEPEVGDFRPRIAFGEDMDGFDHIAAGHLALDLESDRHGIAVLGDFGAVDAHPALDRLAVADCFPDGLRGQRLVGQGDARRKLGGSEGRTAGAGGNQETAAMDAAGYFCL